MNCRPAAAIDRQQSDARQQKQDALRFRHLADHDVRLDHLDEQAVADEELGEVEPGEIEVCDPSNVSSPEIGEIISETEPVVLPEFVTIIDAIRVSPTYPGSPEIARPEPPDDVKLVELVDSSECIISIWAESWSCGECWCKQMKERHIITMEMRIVLPSKTLMVSA